MGRTALVLRPLVSDWSGQSALLSGGGSNANTGIGSPSLLGQGSCRAPGERREFPAEGGVQAGQGGRLLTEMVFLASLHPKPSWDLRSCVRQHPVIALQ